MHTALVVILAPGCEENNPWLTAAYDIDKAARVCLKYMLSRTAESVKSDETQTILATRSVLGPDPDIVVIQELLNDKEYDFDPSDFKVGDEFNRDFDKGSIKNHIEYLNKLVKYANERKAKL